MLTMSIHNSVVGFNNVINGNNYGTQSMELNFSNFSNIRGVRINGRDLRSMPQNMKITIEYTDDKGEQQVKETIAPGCHVKIDGDVGSVDMSNAPLTVKGSVLKDARTSNAKVVVHGDVHGNVETSNGNITASVVRGNARTTNGNIVNKF